MKKQVLSAALASVTAIALLAGCGSTGSTTSTSAAATTDSAKYGIRGWNYHQDVDVP